MDTAHLDAPPEVRANFPFDLADGEKVIFAAPLSCFGTEEDTFLGGRTGSSAAPAHGCT